MPWDCSIPLQPLPKFEWFDNAIEYSMVFKCKCWGAITYFLSYNRYVICVKFCLSRVNYCISSNKHSGMFIFQPFQKWALIGGRAANEGRSFSEERRATLKGSLPPQHHLNIVRG